MRYLQKIFAFLLVFFIPLTLIPCGWEPSEGELYYNFFHQELIGDAQLMPFLYEPSYPYYEAEKKEDLPDPNIVEWQEYLGDGLKKEDIASIVYKMPLKELVEFSRGGLPSNSSSKYAGNGLLKHWINQGPSAAISYLIYAKKCQEQAEEYDYYWDDDNGRDVDVMAALIEEGRSLYAETDDAFLKLRFGYQVVRLAHYSKKRELAVQLFDEFCEPLGLKNHIYYRALEQKAGALQGLESPEAAYLFSIVFDKAPSRREICLTSFGFTNNEDWNASFSMCKNKEEQVVFYLMRGLKSYGFELEEMENIAAVDPASPYLDLLLIRQINKYERDNFPSLGDAKQFPIANSQNEKHINRLKALCEKVLDAPKLPSQDLWKIALGDIALFEHDYATASRHFTSVSSSKYKSQAEILDFVARITALKEIDAQAEEQFAKEYASNQNLNGCQDMKEFMLDAFGMLYKQQDDLAKSFLCYNDLLTLREHLDIHLIIDLEEFIKIPEPNAMERLLLDKIGVNACHHLVEARGTYYLQRNDLEKAIAAFEQLDKNYDSEFYKNLNYMNSTVFSGSMWQIYDRTFEGQGDAIYQKHKFLGDSYDKLSLAKQLQDLEKRAKKEPKNAAEYYYMLGNAWNNMAPYGWHRPILYYNRTNHFVYDLTYNGKEDYAGFYKNYPTYHYFNPLVAMSYFDKAIKLTKDPELQARAAFMAAKAEQQQFHSQLDNLPWRERKNAVNEKRYFKRLTQEFSDTEYYAQMLRECEDLRKYAN